MEDLSAALVEAAWERVLENAGGPGVDGVTVERFAQSAATLLPELRQQVMDGSYFSLPLRKIVVQKRPGSDETRSLHVPAVRDRVAQTAVARMMSRSFEEEFLESSYAYRANRGVDRAIARIQQLRERGYEWVVDGDITAYFDNVSHRMLLERLAEDEGMNKELLPVVRQWVKASIWDGHTVERIRRGIAQGSPISPLLANYYLTPLDVALSRGDHKLIRYSDDFLILCRGETEAGEALTATADGLRTLGLELKAEKTRLTSFAEGFKFLGVRFLGADVMIPWKAKMHGQTRVVSIARAMTGRQLREFRAAARGKKTEPAEDKKAAKPVTRKAKTEEWSMPYLYVTQPGSIVRKSGDRFLVECDGEIVLDAPYHRLEHILVFGNVQLTSQALVEALDHQIAVSLFSRQGRFRGSLQPPAGQNVLLRVKQYALHQDEAAALGAARECIRWKIENCLTVLEKYEERGKLGPAELGKVNRAEEEMTELQAGLDEAGGAAEILGHEGAAAKSYFGALALFNGSAFAWPGRMKHPAKDPLNALLSLSYTMVLQEMAALLGAHGLDPGLGFLHEIDGNRPSLALDLIEPFRGPVADRFVWTLVNRGYFKADDFEQREAGSGVYLRPDPQRKYFEAYEKWMLTPVGSRAGERTWTFRSLLRDEAEAFVRYLRDGGAWSPFSYRSVLGEHNADADHV